jgi:hypothetical protein
LWDSVWDSLAQLSHTNPTSAMRNLGSSRQPNANRGVGRMGFV